MYTSVFPKDCLIWRDQLVEMWMSQGYLRSEVNSYEEGIECFETLAMRSLFQNFERNGHDDRVTHCKMHDIVHDFALFLTKNDSYTMQVDNSDEEYYLKPIDEKTRHLTLEVGYNEKCPKLKYNKMNEKNVRTFFIKSKFYVGGVDSSLFLNLTRLRTLVMARCGFKILPESISGLIHLRYLNLSSNHLEELPKSFSNLCNLQTLDLSNNYPLRKLPDEFGKLVNLKHLYIDHCDSLEELPEQISRAYLLSGYCPLLRHCEDRRIDEL